MSIKFDCSGLNELTKRFEQMSQKAEDLDGIKVGLTELLTNKFMQKYTNFKSLEELFNNSNFKIESEKDLEIINSDEWDLYINRVTKFDNWNELLEHATGDYVAKQLGF